MQAWKASRREQDMTMVERIDWINEVASEDFGRAWGMLDMLNEIYGTEYGFLNKRVVCSDASKDNPAAFYASCHDLHAVLTIG